jgi:hypothetical protein
MKIYQFRESWMLTEVLLRFKMVGHCENRLVFLISKWAGRP